MGLQELDIEFDVESFPENVERFIVASEAKIEAFWDRFTSHKVHQFVACDFRALWGAIQNLLASGQVDGSTFCEWGCGFGVVAGLASIAGFESVGIEAEAFLVQEGQDLLAQHSIRAELWVGNFLPEGVEEMAEPGCTYTCLHHQVPPAYDSHDLGLDDFAVFFVYPWPGEEHFLLDVFERYARVGAIIVLFRGPYHLEAYRKTSARRSRR